MKIVRIFALLVAGLSLSACASFDDFVSRNAPLQAIPENTAETETDPVEARVPSDETVETSVRINDIIVKVPETLKASEANLYLPVGDIDWRGEPRGDRHAQVKAIFETAMARGAKELDGDRRVDLLITVKRFHALTEKARYTVGGVHNIVFDLALADPQTGELVAPWREVRADLKGFGGQEAIEAEAEGQTQKVRITNHLAEVLRSEVATTEGHKNARLGLIQMMNQL